MTISKRPAHSNHTIARLKSQIKQLKLELRQAHSASKSQSSYLANMAHELRTPLNSIIGFAQILDNHTVLTEEQEEYLGLILMSGENLLSLINDILQMSKIESGNAKLTIEEFDLFDLIKGVDTIYDAKATDKNLNYVFKIGDDTPHYIKGDRGKIRQILLNLLSNAIKFTDTGAITLGIHTEPIANEESAFNLVISVQDTGRGIHQDELDQLFKPYQQTETGRSSHQGTGLGLAITKELVEMMDGHIQVQSKWTYGTKFTVTIKLDEANAKDSKKELQIMAKNSEGDSQDNLYREIEATNREILESLRLAATTYSLERVQAIMPNLPSLLAHKVKQCIDEFDFECIIVLVDQFGEQKKSAS